MNVTELLKPNRVLILGGKTDKLGLLKTLAEHAAKVLQIDANRITDAVLNREDLGSTGLGLGVAVPHARIAEAAHPLGVLALLQKPIDYDAIDDEPVDIVFLLIIPANPEALAALASVARLLRHEDLVSVLRQAGSALEAYRIVSDFSAPPP